MLKRVADYGHGVFTQTMVEGKKERNSLRVWLHRHPEMAISWRGEKGDVAIFRLTKKGMKYFEGRDRLSRAESYYSYVDMALFNAYMIEKDSFVNYRLRTHLSVEIGGHKVGLLSPRWGYPREISSLDILLTTPEMRSEYLTDWKIKRYKSEKLRELIESSYVPLALRFLGTQARKVGPQKGKLAKNFG